MNRRTFAMSGAVGLALSSSSAFAQRAARGQETILISELTGAEIDFSASGFKLDSSEVEPSGAYEIFDFEKGDSYLSVSFFAEENVDQANLFDDMLAVSQEEDEGLTIHAHEHLEDGGFTALSFPGIGTYREYQLGSFPGFNLLVMLVSVPDQFQSDFVAVQSVIVGGGPPFLFVAESGVEAIDLEGATASSTGITRRTRSSTSTSDTEPKETNSNSSPAGSQAENESEYIAHTSDHRATLHSSFDRFDESMAVFLDETSSDADAESALQSLLLVAIEWQGYPADIEAIPVPAGLEDVGSLYADWGLAVATVGTSFMSILTDGATADGYNAALAEFAEIDTLLATTIGEASGRSDLVEVARINRNSTRRFADFA